MSGLASGLTSVVAADGYTCALIRAGSVKCWGYNRAGELGDGTTLARYLPVDVVTVSSWRNGDVSCDGAINAIDAELTLQFGGGIPKYPPCAQNMDVNGDGVVNSIDAALILQFGAGLIDHLP